ncbi:cation transporter [Sphingomonas faeni]|uniref:cation transporter n=1 Tax=Sphingomonas faeni TaxID=185950 RepID=UPI0020C7F5DF|nr:cation transporter [Sphingomonas faeni]MCP8892317.1 cation transporter [Sphingomonas faeni]
MVLGAIILVPSMAALWTAYHKFNVPVPPAAIPLTITGLGALVVNFACAMRLAAHRHGSGSLTKAAFLSARNDVFANIAIIGAGLVTLIWRSAWPDLAIGVAIGLLNAGAAWEIWSEAKSEARSRDVEP